MEKIDKDFIEFYKKIGKNMGLDDLTSTLFAKLYIEPEEIAMEDLAKKTGYSLASISNKIHFLETMGLVQKITKPGTRKFFVFMEKDFSKIMLAHIKAKQELVIKPAKQNIPIIIKNNKDANKEKIKILKNYHEQILKMEKMFDHMIKEFKMLK